MMLAGLSARRLTSVQFPRRPCGPSPGLGARTHQSTFSPKGHPSRQIPGAFILSPFFLNPSPRCLSAVFPLLKAQAPHAHVFSASLLVLRLSFTDFPPGHDRRHDIEPVFLRLLAHANDDRKVTGRDAVDRCGFCRWTSTYRSGISLRQQPGDLSQERDRWFESGSPQRRVSNEPSAGDLPEARRQAQCSLQKNGSTFLTSANQAECPMRLFWLHLADLFLGITAVAQFGFLGLSNKKRHPGFHLLTRRYRGLENPLRVTSDIIELDFCQNCRSGRLLGVGRRLDDRGFFSPGIFLKGGGLRLWLPAPGSESPRGRLGRTRPETFARRTRPSSRPLRRPRSAGGPRHQQVPILGALTRLHRWRASCTIRMTVQATTMMTISV